MKDLLLYWLEIDPNDAEQAELLGLRTIDNEILMLTLGLEGEEYQEWLSGFEGKHTDDPKKVMEDLLKALQRYRMKWWQTR